MTINDHLSGDELREALLRTASGVYTSEAAIGLLVAHGSWPLRLEGAGLITVSEATTAAGSNSCYADVLWEEAIATIDAGNMSWGSGSEIRVLRIAASLATGIPVDLGDAVTGLDRHNLALVLAALSHANGSHEHKDYAAERPGDGAQSLSPPTPPSSSWDRSSGGRNEGVKRRCACAGSH